MASRNLEVTVASGDELDVVHYEVDDALAALFAVTLTVRSKNQNVDFDAIVGKDAKFSIHQGPMGTNPPLTRTWAGLASHARLLQVEEKGLATYALTIAPTMWLLTQRNNYRIYQQLSEIDIVLKVLAEWGITPTIELDKGAYKKRKYKVQYRETDFAFVSRMLEEVGVTFYFRQNGDASTLVLSDAPQKNPPRPAKILYADNPNLHTFAGHVATKITIHQKVRPGKYTLREHDYRRQPEYKLMQSAAEGLEVEQRLERYHYAPGAFLFQADKGDDTPFADDKGKTRTDETEGKALAQKRLDAKRVDQKVFTFQTNAYDVAPGVVLSFLSHPRTDLGEDKKLLVTATKFTGTAVGEWELVCSAMSATSAYRPALVTPRPEVRGCESATVVGPKGEEIHTDEFGRVRVHFHWDRYDAWDDNSSCWIHVSQPWAGTGYGGSALPRVGQEVLVDFLNGDPDRPVVVGRVYTNLQKKPYKLPDNKTQSGLRSNSTNRTGGYNELMFEDKAGSELVRFHAQKDNSNTVENDQFNVVKHDRTTFIGTGSGGNDLEVCANDQDLIVQKKRTLKIDQDEAHFNLADFVHNTVNGVAVYRAKRLVDIESEQDVLIHVGDDSYILIQAGKITIQSPRVEINPANGESAGHE